MLSHDLRQAILSRMFGLTLIIGIVVLGYSLYDYSYFFFTYPGHAAEAGPYHYNMFEGFLRTRFGFFSVLAPLLPVLPFGAAFTVERTSGYLRMSLPRTTRSAYLRSKLLTNMLVGGLVILIPHLVIYAAAAILLPAGIPETSFYGRFEPHGPLSDIYLSNPALYCWFTIGLSFVFGAVYATLGTLVSAISDNRFVVMASPFLFFQVGGFILANIGNLEAWLPATTFNLNLVTSATWESLIIHLGGLLLIGIVGTIILGRRQLKLV